MTHTPRSHLSFRLNTLSLGLLSIISQSALAQALESFDQDNPKPNEPAQVYQGEVVEKKETLSPIGGAGSSISHERNRTGNPVRVIWYDGVAQTGAINNGFIRASASGQGLANEDKTDFSGVVLADAIGNGIDAMGFVPHRRPDEVHIQLNDGITNKRLIQGSTTITGGNALLYGNVKSWASGNGVSVASSVDYGTGADVDGYSGATNSGKSPNVESYTENRKKDDADASISDIDKPKNVSARLSKVENHSTITGSIITHGATNTRPDNDPLSSDNLSSLSAKATGSGNGISVITHAFQPKSAGRDDSKKSNNHTNIAELGSVENTGWIEGKALLSGGQYGKETYVYSEASGNGISVAALNNNNPLPDSISGHASHQTTAQISSLNNSGRILAHTQAIAKDNSPHRKIQGSNADAYTFASGNAVSVYAETSESDSHTSPVKALLGNVENTGQMQGSIELQAGNGTGYLDALTKGSGNGLIAYAHPPKPDDGKGMASIGNIHNQGIVAGSVKSKAGISSYGTVTVTEAQPLKIIVADTQNPRKLPLHLPTTPADSTVTSGMEHFRADNTVYASGNGIVGSVGLMARVNHGGNRYGASLGNIDNSGVISGYADLYHGFKSGGSRSSRGFQEITFALVGSGIALDNTFQSALQNTGIISGNHAALMAEGNTGFSRNYTDPTANAYTGTINNYGLMAGTMILGTYHYSADYRQRTESMSQPFRYYELPNPPSQFQNLGQLVRLKAGATGDNRSTTRHDDDQTIASIENGTGGVVSINGKDYTIINGDIQGTDSSHETSESALQYHIVNGVGAAKGALVATQDLDLNNSIVNGLVTAVKLEGDVKFNAQDSTLNTNGFAIKGTDENKRLALLGDDGNQSALFSGKSFINGNMHFGAGDDSLTLEGGELKINGNIIDMGEGNNTITLDGNTTPLKVDYALLNANTLNLNGTVHFTAEGKFQNPTDATINIADTVIYEVNSPTEHAWFDATGNKRTYTIKGDGKMLIDADRLFGNATSDTIDFGKVDLAFGGDECTATGGARFQLSNNALLDMHIEGGDLVMGARTAVAAGGTTSSGTTCVARPAPPVTPAPVTPVPPVTPPVAT
ncbi:MAG: hypothetical protein Q4B71_05155, partial [Cardiobacteriaceae bacterium]|nr:hypothetical protein [Cardiobacteriaceae bacterium]